MAQRLRAHNFSISLDGFGTGEGLTEEHPFGHAGDRLHDWMWETRFGRRMLGEAGGTTAIDNGFAARHGDNFGAEIMGRLKFHTGTGPLPEDWIGPWGEEPPFHTPVFVLTHFPRASLELAGGTTFHFLDAAPVEALRVARDAADGRDVRLGGGVRTIREFLDADLIDELHLVVVPIVLGRGQRLWDGQEGLESRFRIESTKGDRDVVHVELTRRA